MRYSNSIRCLLLLAVLLATLLTGCGQGSKYVGTYVCESGLGSSYITLNGDGTGVSSGFAFSPSSTFNWVVVSDNNIEITNWKEVYGGNSKAELSPDGVSLDVKGVMMSYQKQQK